MGTLYKKIISLCEEKGIKGGKMCTDIGMSKGILTDLKMGRQSGPGRTVQRRSEAGGRPAVRNDRVPVRD